MKNCMKVMLINGSPNQKGCTYTALGQIAEILKKEHVDSEIFWIGKKPLSGCIDCGHCSKAGTCVFDDRVNEFLARAKSADGFIFGSPVHYAALAGTMTSFMDRTFFSDLCGKQNTFYLKPAAAVVSTRRAGSTAALDQLNKYFLHAQMPVIASRYWNIYQMIIEERQ